MVAMSDDPEVLELLRRLGMPDNCVQFQLIAGIKSPLQVVATYYPDLDADPVTRKFKLVAYGEEGQSDDAKT